MNQPLLFQFTMNQLQQSLSTTNQLQHHMLPLFQPIMNQPLLLMLLQFQLTMNQPLQSTMSLLQLIMSLNPIMRSITMNTECQDTPVLTIPAWLRLPTPSSPVPQPPSLQACMLTQSQGVRLTVCVRMEDMDLTELDSSVPMELCLISISSDVKPGTQSTVTRLPSSMHSMLILFSIHSSPSLRLMSMVNLSLNQSSPTLSTLLTQLFMSLLQFLILMLLMLLMLPQSWLMLSMLFLILSMLLIMLQLFQLLFTQSTLLQLLLLLQSLSLMESLHLFTAKTEHLSLSFILLFIVIYKTIQQTKNKRFDQEK